MKKVIVFGGGGSFAIYASEIASKYEILAVADNNKKLYGTRICGYIVISPDEIKNYSYDAIIVCSKYAKEIQEQLLDMDIKEMVLFIPPGIMCDFGTINTAKEIRFYERPFKKSDNDIHILFTQISPCYRTNRFAEILYNSGIKCSLAYFGVLGKETQIFSKCYEQVSHFFSYTDLIDYVKNSDYDLIHCSNEPDVLTCLLQNVGKPIVHDCHDFLTLRDDLTLENIALEYIANSRSNGCIYPSKQCLQIAIDRYGVNHSRAIYFENFPSKNVIPQKKLPKLSTIDHHIHCVYEGAITDNPDSFRYFEEQWSTLAALGIHVHFYTQFREEYCMRLDSLSDYIHYEGNCDTRYLLTALTQYDVGLCTFIEIPNNKLKLDISSPNKLYEYLAAGLPLAFSDHLCFKDFLASYKVGKILDWNDDVRKQLEMISSIIIPNNFVVDNRFTIEDKADELISFYKNIISSYYED